MAKRFLTHIDLSGNQLINASLEKLSADPVSGLFEGRMYYNTASDSIRIYDGTQWIPVGSVVDIQAGQDIDVSSSAGVYTISLEGTIDSNTTGNAATATALQTARTISLAGDVSGSATFDGTSNITITTTVDSESSVNSITGTAGEIDVSASVGNVTISLPATVNADISGTAASATFATTASVANSVAANSVALGTDTTGDYVASVSGSDGVSITGTGEGASVSVANTDKGSSQNIFKTISTDSGTVTAGSNSASVAIEGGNGISTSASGNVITIENTGVHSVSGSGNQIDVSASNGDVTISLPTTVIFPGTVTLHADPQSALEAATKQYVDNAVSGLDWHSAVNLLAASAIALTGTSGTLVIDGHAPLDDNDDGYRLLLKGQTSASANGIYTYADDGSTYTLSRAADADTYQELIGAAVFVMEGTTYASTAWIQTNHYLTDFSGQNWVQFSGTGTYTAGNGLQIVGNQFSIDTNITVDHNTAQTLTNKTLTSPSITNPTVSGLYISDNNIVIEGTADVHETTLIFTDPTADRTITFKDESGTVAFTSDITSALTSYTKKYSANVGNGSATSIAVTHNLATRDVQVQIYDNATYDTVECDVIRTDTNTVTVSFATAPANNAYRVVVIG